MTWLTDMYDQRNRIWAETRELDDLVYAFNVTGNPIMAEKIQDISNRLSGIAQEMGLLVDQKHKDDFEKSLG